jgi:hypothetical protein
MHPMTKVTSSRSLVPFKLPFLLWLLRALDQSLDALHRE